MFYRGQIPDSATVGPRDTPGPQRKATVWMRAAACVCVLRARSLVPARALPPSRLFRCPAALGFARAPPPPRLAGSVQAALDVRRHFGTLRRYGHLDGVHSYHLAPLAFIMTAYFL